MGGGGGKKGGGQKVHLYLAGVQAIGCYGPVDAVTELRFGQRTGWSGRVTGTQSIYIDQPNLFGGNKQEGGVVGQVDIEFGDATQPQNPYLQSHVLTSQVASYNPSFWGPLELGSVASTFGVSGFSSDSFQPIEVPANRGVLGLVFRQFQWAANNPYIKALAVRIERVLAGWDGGAWYPSKAIISLVTQEVITSVTATSGTDTTYSPVGTQPTSSSSVTDGTVTTTTGTFGYNHMNPAHIIYECLTNRIWGMGWPRSMLDDAAFVAAADALYDEGFGISIEWKSQESMDTFIGNLLQHINASLFLDLTTGLFRLVLIRMDYDPSTLLTLDESNILGLDEYQRKAWGETINELVVNYTDVVDGLTKSVTVQDLANIRAQGARITQTHNYPGLPTADLAYRVAVRDLQALSAPLATVQLRINRTGIKLIPGGVFKLSWSALGLSGVVFRVGEIDYGTLTDGTITVTAVEDVFGMPSSTYSVPPVAWVEQSNAPLPASVAQYIEAPYWAIIQKYQGYQISQFDPNFGIGITLAARPSGATIDYDINYSSTSNGTYTAGSSWNAFTPAAQIQTDLVPEATSTFSYLSGPDWESAQVGQVVFANDEAMQLTALDTVNKVATVARGCLDTIPVSHASGSVVWAPGTLYAGFDDVSRVAGETTYYRLTPRNSIGTLDIAKAPTGSIAFNDRYQRPYPPGNFKINGSYWPSGISGALNLSWSHRDRVLQDNQVVPFSSGSIGPEDGTSYHVKIYDESGALIVDDANQTGTSYSFTGETQTPIPGTSGVFSILGDTVTSTELFSTDPSGKYTIVSGSPTITWDSVNQAFDISGSAVQNFIAWNAFGALSTSWKLTGEFIFTADPSGRKHFGFFISDGSGTASGFRISHLDSAWIFDRWSNGSQSTTSTTLSTAVPVSVGGSYSIEVDFDGAGTFTLYVNEALLGSFTDSTYPTLEPGFFVYGASIQVNSLSLTKSVFQTTYRLNAKLEVKLSSVLNSLESTQVYDATVIRDGWGYQYGNNYGGH